MCHLMSPSGSRFPSFQLRDDSLQTGKFTAQIKRLFTHINRFKPFFSHCLTAVKCQSRPARRSRSMWSYKVQVLARKSLLTVTTCFPPAVGLCLAFVLIPSHHWVQAPGPPTQLCQRLPEEGAQIWLGCLNYRSAPKTGHICSIRFQRNKEKKRKSVERH